MTVQSSLAVRRSQHARLMMHRMNVRSKPAGDKAKGQDKHTLVVPSAPAALLTVPKTGASTSTADTLLDSLVFSLLPVQPPKPPCSSQAHVSTALRDRFVRGVLWKKPCICMYREYFILCVGYWKKPCICMYGEYFILCVG